jgi:hypothetical protein
VTRELRRADVCLNCHAEVTGNFCASCGQENTDYRVSLKRLGGDLADEVFQLESRLWRTLWTLFRHPGQLTIDYNAGRRVRFTTPLRLYLLASVVYFFTVSVTARDPKGPINIDLRGAVVTTHDNWLVRWFNHGIERIRHDPTAASRRASQAVVEWGPRIMAVLVPFFALITFVMFRHPRHFFVEHLVFALHLHAAGFFLWWLSDLVRHDSGLVLFIGLVVWTFIAARRVFAQSWWRLAWKLPLISFIYLTTISVGIATVMMLGMLSG